MLVSVRGKGNNVGVTDAIQAAVEKAARKLEKYVSENAELSAVISVEGNLQTAEFTLKDTGVFTRVEETGDDMYSVIHDAGVMLERKIRQYKEKLTAKRAGRPTTRAVAQRVGEVLAGSEDEDVREPDSEIRRIKRFDIKPMFPEDAVLEMELLGHDFFVFQNAEEHCSVNVIYKRKNGGYGLIQPTQD
ncbi:MAG: ribosome-associated translation inhibitor RaiA [Lachnospiraceae bacterium]|nr:ribosome-associated translation inhibitor RaiA [Lachnospiraceae bacterium]